MMEYLAPLAFLVFAAGGAAVLAAFLLQRPLPADVQERVDTAVKGAATRALEKRGEEAALATKIDIFKRFFTLGMPRKWGVTATPWLLLFVALATGGIVWFLLQVLLKLPLWAAIPFTVFAAWFAPQMLARMQQGNADKRFLDFFPDAIDMIVRMLRVGLPVSVAIRTVSREAAAPINGVFTVLADQIDIGIAFEDALAIGSQRIGLPDFRFFAAAVALQRTTGGNLAVTLEMLGEIIRRRRTVRLKARAATGEVRISAYVLASLPFVVIGALLFTSPSYLTPLIADPRGNIILGVGVLMLIVAFAIMRQMMRSAIRM